MSEQLSIKNEAFNNVSVALDQANEQIEKWNGKELEEKIVALKEAKEREKQELSTEIEKQKEIVEELKNQQSRFIEEIEKREKEEEKVQQSVKEKEKQNEEIQSVLKARLAELEQQLVEKDNVIHDLSNQVPTVVEEKKENVAGDDTVDYKGEYEEIQKKYSLQSLRITTLEKQLHVIRSSQSESTALIDQLKQREEEMKKKVEQTSL